MNGTCFPQSHHWAQVYQSGLSMWECVICVTGQNQINCSEKKKMYVKLDALAPFSTIIVFPATFVSCLDLLLCPLNQSSLLHSDIFQVHPPSSNQTLVILKVNLLMLLLVPNSQQFPIKSLSIKALASKSLHETKTLPSGP